MKIEDKLYGREEIKEDLIEEIIKSPALERLKDISQLGMPKEYYHFEGFSRFEHSLGVLVLLRRLNASLEEQVAGLLHDASHTPFSHVIDWVFGDPTKEDYQDKNHVSFLKELGIPKVLMKHGLDFDFISNYKHFKILEREAPSLCADRIDYSLRELFPLRGSEFISNIVRNLSVKRNQIVFLNREVAEIFGREYTFLQKEDWGSDEARARYYILSEVLREAFKDGALKFEDLRRTETPLLEVLNNSKNKKINEKMNLLRNGFKIIESEEGIELKKKFRYVDPEVLVNNHYFPLTSLSEDYSNFLSYEKEKEKEVRKVKIFSC